MSQQSYDANFFDYMTGEAIRSAAAVAPVILGLLGGIRSVVDVGCGTGAWANAFLECGVELALGVDGSYVNQDQVLVDFRSADLERPLPDIGTFDLALCLEVAEHLKYERAASFVADLAKLAPLVVFSAAIPGQGGTGHVNEQWPSYWIDLFSSHGYTCFDALRHEIAQDERISWYYRQNMLLFAKNPYPAGLSGMRVLRQPTDVAFEYVLRSRVTEIGGKQALGVLGRKLASKTRLIARKVAVKV